MNVQLTTQIAEGLPRRRFTVADCFAMVDAGIIGHEERFELIGGEIVPMSPKGVKHEIIKQWLVHEMIMSLSDEYWVMVEPTIHLSEDTFIEPDIVVMRKDYSLSKFTAGEVLLAVEVSNTTFGYDIGKKAVICASASIPDYWVVNAKTRETHIHRAPEDGAYGDITIHDETAVLVPENLPGLALKLAEMK